MSRQEGDTGMCEDPGGRAWGSPWRSPWSALSLLITLSQHPDNGSAPAPATSGFCCSRAQTVRGSALLL